MGDIYYKECNLNGTMHYFPKTDDEVPVWSPRQIRHFLKDVVNDAGRDSVRQSKRHNRLSRLVSETYADIHMPLRKAYRINVKSGEGKQILEDALYKLKNEATEVAKTSGAFGVFSAVVAPPIAIGAAIGMGLYSLGAGVFSATAGVLMGDIVLLGMCIGYTDKISGYFKKRQKVAEDKINERFNRVNVHVNPTGEIPLETANRFMEQEPPAVYHPI